MKFIRTRSRGRHARLYKYSTTYPDGKVVWWSPGGIQRIVRQADNAVDRSKE